MDLSTAIGTIGLFNQELTEHKVPEQLQQLAAKLSQAASAPNPVHDEAFSAGLKLFYSLIEALPSNDWGESQRRIAFALGLTKFTGHGLREAIDSILTANAITRSIAAQRLTELAGQVQTATTTAAQIAAGLSWFGISVKPAELEYCQISLNLPGENAGATLEALDNDLDGFNKLFRFLNEIAGESGVSPIVTGLSTGSFHIDLRACLDVAKNLLALIGGILTLRKQVADLRNTAKRLEEQPDIAQEVIVSINATANNRIEGGLRILAENTAASGALATERVHELSNGLSVSVRFLARKIDEGVRVEVNVPSQLTSAMSSGKTPEQIEELQAELELVKRELKLVAQQQVDRGPVLALADPRETSLGREV